MVDSGLNMIKVVSIIYLYLPCGPNPPRESNADTCPVSLEPVICQIVCEKLGSAQVLLYKTQNPSVWTLHSQFPYSQTFKCVPSPSQHVHSNIRIDQSILILRQHFYTHAVYSQKSGVHHGFHRKISKKTLPSSYKTTPPETMLDLGPYKGVWFSMDGDGVIHLHLCYVVWLIPTNRLFS